MTSRSIVRLLLPACLVLATAAASVSARSAADLAGRYKKEGTKCVWDPNDGGPNQCTPQVVGHFKKDGSACSWVAGEAGADQCRPAKGRFKKEGNACVWNGDDGGPDQCDPKAAK